MFTAEIPSQPIPELEWGRAAYNELLAMTVRYPASHKDNLVKVLESVHPAPATIEEWQGRKVDLSEEELRNLGTKLKSEPVISKVQLTQEQFIEMSTEEPKRETVATWLKKERPASHLLDFIDTVELRLFTDGQEVTIGWERGIEGDEKKKGWVLRSVHLNDAEAKKLFIVLASKHGLVPQTRFIRDDSNDENVLLLSEFIDGEYATQEDIITFRQRLEGKVIDADKWDLNEQNIVKTPDKEIDGKVVKGKLIYVDGDYLEL
ncbi:MAG: hypothetical protein ABIO02_02960 [Patescibacteria group bacterium]